jgi:hypothetical protein
MLNKIIAIATIFVFAFVPIAAKAQEPTEPKGRIITLDKDTPAPFSGILFDIEAALILKVDKKYSLLTDKLKLDSELKKIKSEYDLKLNTLQLSFDTLQNKSNSLLKIKDEEIVRLQDLVKKDPNDHTHWWFAGGIIAGALLSIGIYYAAAEASK